MTRSEKEKKWDEIMDRYLQHFGEYVPTFGPIPVNFDDLEELEAFVDKCVRTNKPWDYYYPYDENSDVLY